MNALRPGYPDLAKTEKSMKPRPAASRFVCLAFCTVAVVAGRTACAESASTVKITADGGRLTICEGTRPVAVYRCSGAPFKPYLRELYTPAGVNVLLDSPADHLHHHGLMFALEINGVDFWGETQDPACGIQRQVSPPKTETIVRQGGAVSRIVQRLDWIAPDDAKPLAAEQRTIRFHPGRDDVTLLTWSTKLEPAPGRSHITLDGRHYFGLGMRFVRDMDRTGTFFNPDNLPGEVFRGDERLLRSRWCAYTAEIGGKPVTVAMFDSTANPRHPATWFTMKDPFAYLAATLALHEKSLVLEAESPLHLTYGVALWDGKIEAARIDALYKEWLKMISPDVEDKNGMQKT